MTMTEDPWEIHGIARSVGSVGCAGLVWLVTRRQIGACRRAANQKSKLVSDLVVEVRAWRRLRLTPGRDATVGAASSVAHRFASRGGGGCRRCGCARGRSGGGRGRLHRLRRLGRLLWPLHLRVDVPDPR